MISMVLTTRLKAVIHFLVSSSQAAFVSGRSISDQILLMQDLVWNYCRNNTPGRSALKIDIMKAFGFVSWNLIHDILEAFEFPVTFRKWITTRSAIPEYSLSVDALKGILLVKRALDKGTLFPLVFLSWS